MADPHEHRKGSRRTDTLIGLFTHTHTRTHMMSKEVQRDTKVTEWIDVIIPDCSVELMMSHV